jgi:hypothetical protein
VVTIRPVPGLRTRTIEDGLRAGSHDPRGVAV